MTAWRFQAHGLVFVVDHVKRVPASGSVALCGFCVAGALRAKERARIRPE
jgi:hypothetical protein